MHGEMSGCKPGVRLLRVVSSYACPVVLQEGGTRAGTPPLPRACLPLPRRAALRSARGVRPGAAWPARAPPAPAAASGRAAGAPGEARAAAAPVLAARPQELHRFHQPLGKRLERRPRLAGSGAAEERWVGKGGSGGSCRGRPGRSIALPQERRMLRIAKFIWRWALRWGAGLMEGNGSK